MPAPRAIKLKILELRREKKSYREIESIVNCSRGTISYHCTKHNLTDLGQKRYAVGNDLKLQIAEYCKTNSVDNAVKHFGLSKRTIFKYKKFVKPNEQE
jgi:hypothetical protein